MTIGKADDGSRSQPKGLHHRNRDASSYNHFKQKHFKLTAMDRIWDEGVLNELNLPRVGWNASESSVGCDENGVCRKMKVREKKFRDKRKSNIYWGSP